MPIDQTVQPPASLKALVAQAYADAVLGDADMVTATQAIEAMHKAMRRSTSLLVTWDALDDMVNRAANLPALLPILKAIRDKWLTIVVDEKKQQLAASLITDPATGGGAWLSQLAEAVGELRWDYAEALLEDGPHLPRLDNPSVPMLRRWIEFGRWRYWKDARPLFIHLAHETTLAAPLRVRAYGLLAEIDAVIVGDEASARAMLDEAGKLVEADWFLETAWAVLLLSSESPDEARLSEAERHARSALSLAPQMATVHTTLGNLAEKRKDPSAAEEHYEKATGCPIGAVSAWEDFIKLWADRDLFAKRRTGIPRAVERVGNCPLHRLSTGFAFMTAGDTCRKNAEYDEALAWYRQAQEADARWADPHYGIGQCLQALDRLLEAASAFDQAAKLEIDPDSAQMAWALALAAEARNDQEKFADHCLAAMKREPKWRDDLTVRLQDLAQTFYREQSKAEPALSIYTGLREILGESYERNYRRLRGHLFYFTARFREAAEEYRQGAKADPNDPWSRFNAGLALLSDKNPVGMAERLSEAESHLRRAVELEPANAQFQTTHDRIARSKAFVSREGEGVLQLPPINARIQVWLPSDLVPVIVADGQITPDTNAKLLALSGSMKHETDGFVLPSVVFSTLSAKVLELPSDLPVAPDLTQIEVMGRLAQTLHIKPGHCLVPADARAHAPGWLPAERLPAAWPSAGWVPAAAAARLREAGHPAEGPLDVLIRAIEGVARAHMPELFGHAMAQAAASAAAPSKPRVAGARLNQLTAQQRHRLGEDGRLGKLKELLDTDGRVAPEPASPPRIPGPVTPTLRLPPSRAAWRTVMGKLQKDIQKHIWAATQFVVPRELRLEIDDALKDTDAEIALQEGRAPVHIALPAGTDAYAADLLSFMVARELCAYAPLLLDADAAAFNLGRLAGEAGVAVGVAEQLFKGEELAGRLRACADPGPWQGNFLACLELALLASAPPPHEEAQAAAN